MKNIKKIYVVGNATYYASWIKDIELVSDIKDADIVLFTGGEDVTPAYYGCEPHPTTYNNPKRDAYEKEIFDQVSDNQLVVGICRGSQWCCVMNGGLLIQDCDNHAIRYTHPITELSTNRIYEVTSTHHQMQYPFNLNANEYTILMQSTLNRCNYYHGDKIDVDEIYCEPEVVLYHKEDLPYCLAIQGHPEMMRSEAPIIERLNEYINLCLDKVCK